MDVATAQRLIALNNAFYAKASASFGQTRHNRWLGWDALLDCVPCPQTVADLACGNKRFEAYLMQRFPQQAFEFWTVDNAPFEDWIAEGARVHHVQADLLSDVPWGAPPCDLAVSFGFLHHVPGQDARVAFMERLLDCVKPGGHAAVSLWRFLDDASLAARVVPPSQVGFDAAALDAGDAFLGWDNQPGLYRYCHSFSDEDVDALVQAVAARATAVARYRSDGRSGALNEYVVFRA